MSKTYREFTAEETILRSFFKKGDAKRAKNILHELKPYLKRPVRFPDPIEDGNINDITMINYNTDIHNEIEAKEAIVAYNEVAREFRSEEIKAGKFAGTTKMSGRKIKNNNWKPPKSHKLNKKKLSATLLKYA